MIKARQQMAAAAKREAGFSGLWASFAGDTTPAGGSTAWSTTGGPSTPEDRIDGGGKQARRAAATSIGAAAAARRCGSLPQGSLLAMGGCGALVSAGGRDRETGKMEWEREGGQE